MKEGQRLRQEGKSFISKVSGGKRGLTVGQKLERVRSNHPTKVLCRMQNALQ